MIFSFKRNHKRLVVFLSVLLFSGCAVYAGLNYDQLYGKPSPQQRIAPSESKMALNYLTEVKPIIEQRCVVCHACYDAPCQLKMSSAEGIDRGANKEKVYEGTRLLASNLTRMFVDAQTTEEWRELGFNPVLNEREQSPEANTQAGVMARLLQLKQAHPLPDQKVLDADKWDFSLDRDQQCPTIEEMAQYENNYPEWGMPYGLPQLADGENNVLMQWLEAGSPMASVAPPSEATLAKVAQWEAFLNGDSLKQQLTSRYIYEHLFVSHLYFDDEKEPVYFDLVRSRTAPGQPVDLIATRRPFDDPKVDRVYYRFVQVRETIVDKTHMPYALNPAKMARIKSLFIEPDYNVDSLPSYDPESSANPLMSFTQLPVQARYKFMLDNAQNTIMGFIKGPVCRGQLALNVINDRFWVFFVDPDMADLPSVNEFYASQAHNLRMPAEEESNTIPLTNWLRYAKQQGDFLRAKNDFMKQTFKNGEHLTPRVIWNGNNENDHAALTVFRHFDSATVTKGLVGAEPKTAWVLDYSLLERVHYLLVAGFDVYGNFGHQLVTRMYMDFLRMEGESNFLSLLPAEVRHDELADWYQDSNKSLKTFLQGDINEFDQPSGIQFKTDNPKHELFTLLQQHVAPVRSDRYDIDAAELGTEAIAALTTLGRLSGEHVHLFPELSFIMVEPTNPATKAQLFTLVRNSAHRNISSLFDEESNRLFERDNVTLVRGLLGSYPGAFWHVKEADLPKLLEKVQQVKSEQTYAELLDAFGVRRTSAEFWSFSDKLNQINQENFPIESGLLDYNRIENR
ncbi:9-hexadecenoic acid cis-trans isomerase [Photobacterium jeanii]|uniref:9-hexadecenoic acid cis-trans isomerase n=1 Tax=Photobacterium jeanii TaxID=858640 RepID=A0A178K2W7_9GAMM|nr:fatty acid cis/trans isomerase [Photobacterium jeanii]OAN11621.1 9-hexadecenoic acid cis-trans isomerase [Photobacterium jeanii]PST91142.1 9-hexadecenoic acid cis-trans isomerase [Photobacterium jeanii]